LVLEPLAADRTEAFERAAAINVVGVLLVSALVVIPVAAARPFARSPEGMAVLAALAAFLAVAAGLWASWTWDLPAGPAIVSAALVLVVVGLPVRRRG
jgi:zinc transport system permease protein